MNHHHCPHCGLPLEDDLPQPTATDAEVAATLAAVCTVYFACIALIIGLVSGSPTVVFIASAVAVGTVAASLHHIRREQRELMEYLSSDESEPLLPPDEQPLPHIPLW